MKQNKFDLVMDYIDANISQDVETIKKGIFNLIGYNSNTFGNCFQILTDKTLFHYINERKMYFAAQSLKNDIDKSIADIALDWNYSDQSAFSRAFKAFCKATPNDIMECIVSNPRLDVYDKENLIQQSIQGLSHRNDLEPMELFQKYIFPVAISDADEYIAFCIPKWEEMMQEHIEYAEENYEKYAYSRKNVWREKYRDNDMNPTRYDTEEEYLNAVYEGRYGWRKYCSNRFGIDPANFETRSEYDTAINAEYSKEREARAKAREADPTNMALYSFCKVKVSQYYDAPYYYYFTGGLHLKVGDYVTVPFGRDDTLTKAQVMSVGECYGCALPCHISKIKTVVKKWNEEKNNE